MLRIFCKVGASGSGYCMNIALLLQHILLFKCFCGSVLSAGVKGVGCTLSS